jgi:hypothetical protein
MKDEEFQLDSAESKNTLLTNMFTGTALFISFLLSLSLVYDISPLTVDKD